MGAAIIIGIIILIIFLALIKSQSPNSPSDPITKKSQTINSPSAHVLKTNQPVNMPLVPVPRINQPLDKPKQLITDKNQTSNSQVSFAITTSISDLSTRVPKPIGIEFVANYFGDKWFVFLSGKSNSFNIPKSFKDTIAFAFENLSVSDKQDFLFLNNYEALHQGTLNLLQTNTFSDGSMMNLFKELIERRRQQREEDRIKKEQDKSIIDVTGNSYKLDNFENLYPTSISPTTPQQVNSYQDYDPNEYRLGKLYKEKLKLSNQEVSWLNKFWNPSNVFLSIEGCCIETIKLYLEILKELNKQFKKKETTIAKEVDFLQTEILKFYQSNSPSSYSGYDANYVKERAESEIFCTVFKRAENIVRQAFEHKRKLSCDFSYSNKPILDEFENRIGNTVNQIIQSLTSTISQPDEPTEIELNAQNVNRWKIKFEQLANSYTEQAKQEFINGIYALEKGNQKNSSIENIFFEASKFIAKFDKVEALKFYIYYLYYDLKSDKIDNKQLTKTIQKNLFKNNEQLHDFQKVVGELVSSKNLKRAIEDVQEIYKLKRKIIQLNISAIKEVEQQDKDTVELLNEYLQDEFEDENTNIKSEEINSEEVKIKITTKENIETGSVFADGIKLNEIQIEVISLFANKSFSIPQNEIENYCKSKGVFKNQLIDSINENCYNKLDDVLIEEDGDTYSINENYYKKISIK